MKRFSGTVEAKRGVLDVWDRGLFLPPNWWRGVPIVGGRLGTEVEGGYRFAPTMSLVAGSWISSDQKTAETKGCNCGSSAGRISITALLELARWCQQLRSFPQGGDSCQPSTSALVPPVSSTDSGADSAGETLASVDRESAQGPLPVAGRTAGSSVGATHQAQQGGAQ
jgi:hypothetical protein